MMTQQVIDTISKNYTIVVIDNNTYRISSLCLALTQEFSVYFASTKTEVEHLLTHHAHLDIDLFLIDEYLSLSDNSLINVIKQDCRYEATPRLFLSSFNELSALHNLAPDEQLHISQKLVKRLKNHAMSGRFVKQLETDTIKDPLTGLLNRYGLQQQLHHLWQYTISSTANILTFTLKIHGLSELDERHENRFSVLCLKQLGNVLQSHCRRSSDVAARIGRDEFILVFSDFDNEHVNQMIFKIEHSVESITVKINYVEVKEFLTVDVDTAFIAPQKQDNINALLGIAS